MLVFVFALLTEDNACNFRIAVSTRSLSPNGSVNHRSLHESVKTPRYMSLLHNEFSLQIPISQFLVNSSVSDCFGTAIKSKNKFPA